MRRLFRALSALALLGVLATGSAAAEVVDAGPNGEQVDFSFSGKAASGNLYRSGEVAASLRIEVSLTAPYDPSAPTHPILPTKQGRVILPGDFRFHPKTTMPPCSDEKMNPNTDLSVAPSVAISLCPESVIGNGTSSIYIAGANLSGGPSLRDVALVIFHAGFTSEKRPKIKIYGYSKGLNAGLLMQGYLEADGSIAIAVPELPLNSAVGRYDLNVPGNTLTYEGKPLAGSKGLDPTYVMARCSTGEWLTSAVATLGYFPAGDLMPVDPDVQVAAPDSRTPCVGKPGKPPWGKLSLKGPAATQRGKAAPYRVTLKNSLGLDLNGVKITAKGKGASGKAKIAKATGGTGSAAVKVKFKRKGKIKLTFTASGKSGAPVKATKVVKVK